MYLIEKQKENLAKRKTTILQEIYAIKEQLENCSRAYVSSNDGEGNYDDSGILARKEQLINELRNINMLLESVNKTILVDEEVESVSLGSNVVIRYLEKHETPKELDPKFDEDNIEELVLVEITDGLNMVAEGYTSLSSPVGSAIYGKKAGDFVTIYQNNEIFPQESRTFNAVILEVNQNSKTL